MLDRRGFLASAAAASLAPVLAQASSADVALDAYLTQYLDESLDRRPETLTGLGLDKGARAQARYKLSDASLAERDRDVERSQAYFAKLKTFGADLSPSSQVALASAKFRAEVVVDYAKLVSYGRAAGYVEPYALSQLTGSYQSVPDFLDSQHRIDTAEDADAYLSRLEACAVELDQELDVVRHDAGLGVFAPDFDLKATVDQLGVLIDVTPSESGLVKSLARRAAAKGLPSTYAARAEEAFRAKVQPALERQRAAARDLLGRATHEAGVWRLPKGDEIYAVALRANTTTNLSASEIHDIGKAQVADLEAQIQAIFDKTGFPAGSFSDRMNALNARPDQLFANTDDGKLEILKYLNGEIAKIYLKLPQAFERLPKASIEVRRVPKAIQDGAPNGYYSRPSLDGSRPGAYYINLKDSADWPKYSLKTLTYHEAVPGHHLQNAILQETGALPLYRRLGGYAAYGEGWGLYAEVLADELGAYDGDPLGRLGYLQSFLFRAVRLVVDTGMHAKHWSREQAIQYMVAHTGQTVGRVTREIDRYTVWPGQACAYKIGQIEIVKLREAAKAKLGPKFDLKGFHTAVLAQGSAPLPVLGDIVKAWVASRA